MPDVCGILPDEEEVAFSLLGPGGGGDGFGYGGRQQLVVVVQDQPLSFYGMLEILDSSANRSSLSNVL